MKSNNRVKVVGGPKPILIPDGRPDILRSYVDNPALAYEALQALAEGDRGEASAAIAHMYLNESIQTLERSENVNRWADLAIEQGSPYGYWVKAWSQFEVDRVADALSNLERALELDFAPAAIDLGVLYQSGRFVEADLRRSRDYILDAQRLGHAFAEWHLQNLYVTGTFGVSKYCLACVLRPLSYVAWRLRLMFGAMATPATLYRGRRWHKE